MGTCCFSQLDHGSTEDTGHGLTWITPVQKDQMFDPCQSVKSVAKNLAKAGAADLAEVFAFHFDDAAHFMQAGAHAFSDPVPQGFAAR
jgi:hypothetical protein